MTSRDTLSFLLGLSIIISLIGIFSLPDGFLTGLATTDTGQVRINITQSININVTNRVIDFGNGTITPGKINCSMDSEKGGDPGNCFTSTWGGNVSRKGITVRNIGNTFVNITAQSTYATEAAFWEGNPGYYKFKCNSTAAGATVAMTTWTAPAGAALNCIYNLTPTFLVELNVNITIPSTAIGFYNDTITFAAVKF